MKSSSLGYMSFILTTIVLTLVVIFLFYLMFSHYCTVQSKICKDAQNILLHDSLLPSSNALAILSLEKWIFCAYHAHQPSCVIH
jgi:hypothetical protein